MVLLLWKNVLQRISSLSLSSSSSSSSSLTLQWSRLFLNNNNHHHHHLYPMPQLVGMPPMMTEQQQEALQHSHNNDNDNDNDSDDYSIWFAVPKRKHTKSRKRMKTTSQKKLPLKKNIIFDPRTGEVTLMHKLPFNWKDYLPKMEK